MQVIAVVMVVVRCEKLFKKRLIAHFAGEQIESGDSFLTTHIPLEAAVYAEVLAAKLELVKIDRQPIRMVAESSAARTPVGISPRKANLAHSVSLKHWTESIQGDGQSAVQLKRSAVVGPKNNPA